MAQKRCSSDDGNNNDETRKIQCRERLGLVTSARKIVDLTDDVLKRVLLFLDFRERSKLRGVCRHMKNFVDGMPPPNTSLDIRFLNDVSVFSIKWDAANSCVKIQMDKRMDISRLPPLRTIRPATLDIHSNWWDDEYEGFDIGVVGHLAEEVGSTVTNLTVFGLAAENLLAVQQTFTRLNDFFSGLRKLKLNSIFPLSYALSAISCLRSLESVHLMLRRDMISTWRDDPYSMGLHLSALASLPNLRSLNIELDQNLIEEDEDGIQADENVMNSFIVGCSNIRQLTNLSSRMLADFGDVYQCQNNLAFMLSRLDKLEELSALYYPSRELWEEVKSMGGHKILQKLTICYCYYSIRQVEELAAGCVQCFPSLTELNVHFEGSHENTYAASVRALAGLQLHTSLRRVNCGFHDGYCKKAARDAIKILDQNLGQRVTVREISHFEDGGLVRYLLRMMP